MNSAQRRPFVARFRNAINGNTEGRRFRTEAEALAYATNYDNHPFNNTQVWVLEDRRDGSHAREILVNA